MGNLIKPRSMLTISPAARSGSNQTGYMGNAIIMKNKNNKHLGVNTNTYLSHKINIKDATNTRLKETFLSLVYTADFFTKTICIHACALNV